MHIHILYAHTNPLSVTTHTHTHTHTYTHTRTHTASSKNLWRNLNKNVKATAERDFLSTHPAPSCSFTTPRSRVQYNTHRAQTLFKGSKSEVKCKCRVTLLCFQKARSEVRVQRSD